jgi:hypothetical protein
MRSFFDSKHWKIILICAALLALVFLSIGLRDVEFKPSQSTGLENQGEDDSGRPLKIPSFLSLTSFQQVIILLVIVGLLVAMWFVLPADVRKRLSIILFVLTLFVVLYSHFFEPKTVSREGAPTQPANSENLEPAANVTPQSLPPPTEFQPPQVSYWALYLVGFAMAGILFLAGWMLYRFRQPKPVLAEFEAWEEIGEAARLALDDLAAGHAEEDAVIRCYERMSGVVNQRRGLQRADSMTAAEFATRLEAGGLPRDAVRRLTRLFESARYGLGSSRPMDVEEAKACLTEIARFCGEMV